MAKKTFLTEDFLLHTSAARTLYHEFAKEMPIFDYHCHLPPDQIAADRKFENMTEAWLAGDHYKWRAMRANGVNERYITGDAPDDEKFNAWANAVPATLRNPLYHWTHLELRNPFGINELLDGDSAQGIYERCGEMLQDDAFSTRGLLTQMQVKVICTTDDPVDSLEHHQALAQEDWGTKVYPTFRPDRGMGTENLPAFNEWIAQLEKASGVSCDTFSRYLEATRERHDFFHENGCRLSDHGLIEPFAAVYTDAEVEVIFDKARCGRELSVSEDRKFKSAMLYEWGLMDCEKGWVQQYHLGPIRNNSSRMFQKVGPDAGFDSMSDRPMAEGLSRLLDRLDANGNLARTILYNLNANDNDVFATMAGNFQDGEIPGKMQFGSGWWFHDQKQGMINQLNCLSNMGLLSRFVGMLTDSRSFLSYPRHEYFRRILCMLLGEDVAKGELPDDMEMLGNLVQDICFNNARNYFSMEA